MPTIDSVNTLIKEVTDNVDSKLKCSMVSLDLSKALLIPLLIIFYLINVDIVELKVYTYMLKTYEKLSI